MEIDDLCSAFGTAVKTDAVEELVKKFINVTQCEKKYGASESRRVAKFFLDAAKGEHGNQLATAISNYFRDPTFFLPPIAPEASSRVAPDSQRILSMLSKQAVKGGQEFQLTYMFKNTGESNWPTDTQLRPSNAVATQFQFAYKCRGDTRPVPSRNIPLKATQTVVLECRFKAPMSAGGYAACWRLGYMLPQLKRTPEFFGPTLWVNLVVKPSAGDGALRAPSLPPASTVMPSASTVMSPASTVMSPASTASTLVQPMTQVPSAAVEDSSLMDEDDDL